MQINADLAGTLIKTSQTTVSWRQTTNYAAAVADPNPAYFDDLKEGVLVSHPVFPVAVTWPVLSRLDQFIASEAFPAEILMTQVHYSEHLVLHRLIRPGDELFLTGMLTALLPHRAGTHAIIRLDASDAGQRPVFTEYVGAMLRGVSCGRGSQIEPLPMVPENRSKSDNIWESDIYIDALRPYLYDGCTDIEFPIHTSLKFATAVGLPGIILQGTATLALGIREIVNVAADGDPSRIAQIACRFTGMVKPESHIQVCCTGENRHKAYTDIFFEVRNNDQEKVIRNGYVKLMKRGTL